MLTSNLTAGARVLLVDEPDCIIPDGWHEVSRVNDDGSFHCGGNTAVWPRRIIEIKAKTPKVGATRETST